MSKYIADKLNYSEKDINVNNYLAKSFGGNYLKLDPSTKEFKPPIGDMYAFTKRMKLLNNTYLQMFKLTEMTIIITHVEIMNQLFYECNNCIMAHNLVNLFPCTKFRVLYEFKNNREGKTSKYLDIDGEVLVLYNWMRKNTTVQLSFRENNSKPLMPLVNILTKNSMNRISLNNSFMIYINFDFNIEDQRVKFKNFLKDNKLPFSYCCITDSLNIYNKYLENNLSIIKRTILLFDEWLWKQVRLFMCLHFDWLPSDLVKFILYILLENIRRG
jgi:hypothetical protein